jgi:hypothetical protein
MLTYHVCNRPNISNRAEMRSSASQRSYRYITAIQIKKYLDYESVIPGVYVWALSSKLQGFLQKFHLTTQKKFPSDRLLCTFKRDVKVPLTWCALLLHLQQIYFNIYIYMYTNARACTRTRRHARTRTWRLPAPSQSEFMEKYPTDVTLHVRF